MGTLVKQKLIRTLTMLSAILAGTVTLHAQMSITGPTCITPGTQYQYIISGNWNGGTNMQWCLNGGTITGNGQCISGTPYPSIYVIWSTGGTKSVSLTTSNPSSTTSKNVYENVTFSPGTITSNSTQTITSTTTPASINCAVATGGGCGATNYLYQWEQSPDNVTFSNFGTATGQNLSFSGPLAHSTYLRRKVTETSSNTTAYSDVAVVFVDPLIGGTIISSAQFVLYNTIPTNILATDATSGTCGGAYVYQWQKSTDNVNFTDISSATNYFLGFSSPVTQTAFYRRKTSCAGEIQYTGSVKITTSTNPGVVGSSQVISDGGSISAFNLSGVAGGDCSGSYTYQWQQSFNEIDWIDVPGATSTTYTAILPESYKYYRVKVICGGEIVYSNNVRIKNAAINAVNTPNSSSATASLTPVAMPAYPGGTDANNINYIRVRSFIKPGITDIATANSLTDKYDVSQATQYFDGLGRGLQTVAKNATPAGNDIIATNFYDQFGRLVQKYLPYTDNLATGNFRLDPATQQPAFYNSYFSNTESFYYSKVNYEASSLNTVLQETAPGKSWTGSGKGARVEIRSNTTAEDVKKWTIDYTTGSVPQVAGAYTDGQLIVSLTSDEQDNKIIEYKTIEGQVILKKVQQADLYQPSYPGWICTYYVYDDFNLLRFVIQPRAVEWLVVNSWSFAATGGSQVVADLCFRYEFDQRRRMIVKKVPGADEVWMVYDARDRLVMTQDARLRTQATKQWMVMEYDALNRPAKTGLWDDANNRSFHESLAYPSTNYPAASSGYEVLSETFYDEYTYAGVKTYDPSYAANLQAGANRYAETVTKTTMTRGMVTGTRVKIVTTSNYLITTTYYDNKARAEQSLADNISTGVDISTMQYDFSGKILSNYLRHQLGATSYTTLTKMLYDHGGRLLETRKVFNGGAEVLIATNSYDELGQLKTKQLGQKTDLSFLETLDYKYNIRGWLNGINRGYANMAYTTEAAAQANRWFGMELNYDYGFTRNLYNGNISGTRWRSKGNGEQRAYGFSYDNVNRLLKADFTQYTSSTWNISAGIDFSLGGDPLTGGTMKYDANGNIMEMWQTGLKINSSTVIDKLTYTYKNNYSNQLAKVTDGIATTDNGKLGDFKDGTNSGADDYNYDVNGNLNIDNNKSISSITYNYLNLPSVITVAGKGSITYTYDAGGTKIKKVTSDITTAGKTITNTTTYIAGFIYESKQTIPANIPNDDYSDKLQFAGQEEGRIRSLYNNPTTPNTITGFAYDYFIKDHLGNIRMVLTDEQKQDYYPATTLEGSTTVGVLSMINYEKQFYTIDNTKVVTKPWTSTSFDYVNNNGIINPYPSDYTTNTSSTSTKVYKLNATTNTITNTTGLGIVLKVMAGDNINIFGKSYHKRPIGTFGYNAVSPATILVTDLINAFAVTGIVGTKGIAGSQITGQPGFPTTMNGLIGNQLAQGNGRPKASINWIVFDEQFKYVSGGFDMVGDAGTYTGGTAKTHNNSTIPAISIPKNGYIYVYCSNESKFDVFFDNLQLIHNRGPLLEETHYYPFGLTMNGISSKVLNNSPANKSKFNGAELNTDFDLNQYEFFYRNYDPQIGRWHSLDTKPVDMISPYAAMANNPIRFTDPLGDTAVYFRPDGSFWKFQDDGKKAFSGVFFQKSEVTSTYEKDGVQYEVNTYSDGVNFQFNDAAVDVQAIKNGEITNVAMATDALVNNEMEKSGVNSADPKKGFSYAKENSTASGKMDYGMQDNLLKNTFYLRGGTAYNVADFGNYLWGRGMAQLEVDLPLATIGAHYNNFVNGRRGRDVTEKYNFGPGTYGSPGLFDSKSDQRAIISGYMNNPKYPMLQQREYNRYKGIPYTGH